MMRFVQEKYMKDSRLIYKRVAIIGAIGNPNVGDEAILAMNIEKIRKMYGDNCIIYVFSKDAAYTSLYSAEDDNIIATDYLHKFTLSCKYDTSIMEQKSDEFLNYPEHHTYNMEYEAIHQIFRSIDILHIIGGGYLNSIWPDMLYEVLFATRIAKKYNKKYFATGISVNPMNEPYISALQEIIDGAEFADFRDNSYLNIGLDRITNCLTTVDDMVELKTEKHQSGYLEKYATMLFHEWNNRDEIAEKVNSCIIPFMNYCLKRGLIDKFYILAFSEGDFEVWEKLNILNQFQGKVQFENCINQPVAFAKNIIANAAFNVGSRFHQAVFSLSAQVPVLSVWYDEYYQNKLASIHDLFDSRELYSIKELTYDCMVEFAESLNSLSYNISRARDNVSGIINIKNMKIAEGYAENKKEMGTNMMRLKENRMPKISVIIPIYNMDAYLRDCLNSVLSQTLNDIEIICINDGSTDYSQMILEEYAWKDKRIRVISQTNQGVAVARNNGIEQAKGEFLFFLDPDDWLPDNETFTDLYKAAKDNNVLVCGGSFEEHSPCGVIKKWDGNLSKYTFDEDKLMKYEDYQFDYGWVRFIYNREFIIRNNLRLPELIFFEDPVFFVRVMHEANTFYALRRSTYCYRTGYKSSDLPYSKALDLIKGLYNNIKFAKENGYDQLVALELARIENDYSDKIVKYLAGSSNAEFREVFEKINQIVYSDNNRIEYNIYNKMIANKNYEIWSTERKIEEKFYNSTTWKVGNSILYIPKMLKQLLKKS